MAPVESIGLSLRLMAKEEECVSKVCIFCDWGLMCQEHLKKHRTGEI